MELLECQGCHQLEYSDPTKPCSLCKYANRARPTAKVWRHKYSKETKPKGKGPKQK